MAADRNFALWIAYTEYDYGVSIKDFPARVLDYFRVSTGRSWTVPTAVTQSWCGHFVYWVLYYAGLAGNINRGGPTIGRFLKSQGGRFRDYSKSDYEPKGL